MNPCSASLPTAVTAMEIATPIGTKEAVSHFTIRELTYSVTAHRLDIDSLPYKLRMRQFMKYRPQHAIAGNASCRYVGRTPRKMIGTRACGGL